MKRAVLALGLLLPLLLPATASANGRFPESNQLFFAPNDDQLLVLRTTFGFLVSKDRGGTWRWVCEQAFPLSSSEDPMVAITPNGNILATTFQGMTLSKSKACNWEFLKGAPLANPDPKDPNNDRGRVFIDLAVNPTDAKNVVVFASTYDRQDEDGGVYFSSQLFETKDEGATFTKLGPDLEASLLGYTHDLTKSDPQRLYITAVRNPGGPVAAFLLTSKDRGQTYTETPIALENEERGVYIAAVDPNDAERIYVRTSAGTDKPSRLLLSENGGQTWRVLLTGAGPLVGFALAPDGSKVYVGGPKDGIQVASTADFVFTQTSKIETQCLALGTDGLWACSNERSGFIIALSKDEGVTFEKKTHFCDIEGALDCPAGTSTNTECVSRWPAQAGVLGCIADDAGPADAGAPDSALPEGDALVEPGGGCTCHMTQASPFAALGSAALGALGVVALLRRRSSARR